MNGRQDVFLLKRVPLQVGRRSYIEEVFWNSTKPRKKTHDKTINNTTKPKEKVASLPKSNQNQDQIALQAASMDEVLKLAQAKAPAKSRWGLTTGRRGKTRKKRHFERKKRGKPMKPGVPLFQNPFLLDAQLNIGHHRFFFGGGAFLPISGDVYEGNMRDLVYPGCYWEAPSNFCLRCPFRTILSAVFITERGLKGWGERTRSGHWKSQA